MRGDNVMKCNCGQYQDNEEKKKKKGIGLLKDLFIWENYINAHIVVRCGQNI